MVAPGRRGENRSTRTVRGALVSSTLLVGIGLAVVVVVGLNMRCVLFSFYYMWVVSGAWTSRLICATFGIGDVFA